MGLFCKVARDEQGGNYQWPIYFGTLAQLPYCAGLASPMVALDVAAGDGMANDGTVTAAVAAAAAVVANTQQAGPHDEYPPFELTKG